MRASDRPSSQKNWVIGCGSVAFLFLLAVVIFGGMVALERRREVEPVAIDHTFSVPQTGEGGTLELDLEGVELAIVPGAAGEPIRVGGGFDAAGFRLITERSTTDDGRWRYKLRLRPKSLLSFVIERGEGIEKMLVTLPRGAAISLEGNVAAGVTDIELGGLDVVEIDLRLGAGEHRIAFSEPLVEPMQRLKLDSPLGELTLVKLGNASPGEIRIGKQVGEASVDLSGAWRNDTRIEIDCGVGSCDLHRPLESEATIRLEADEDPPADAKRPVISVEMIGAAMTLPRGAPSHPR